MLEFKHTSHTQNKIYKFDKFKIKSMKNINAILRNLTRISTVNKIYYKIKIEKFYTSDIAYMNMEQ